MKTKKCSKCGETKLVSEFYKRSYHKDGLSYHCKSCEKKSNKEYRHSKIGLIAHIYTNQRFVSRHRNHIMPSYSLPELRKWILSQKKFHKLFNDWKASNFDKMLTPSCDRFDDYKPYTLDNIQLVTWKENKAKGNKDIINGINNKQSKAVLQFTKQNEFVKEYYSISQAYRETGIHCSSISGCCKGKYGFRTAGGFVWRYKG